VSRTAVVLGARNLGGAIVDRFLADGLNVAAVARSPETLEAVESRGALAIGADAADPAELERALTQARERFGSLHTIVNAVSPRRAPGAPFGGGPIADAAPEAFEEWAAVNARQAFLFLSLGIRALRAGGGGGALIQITGGSSRRGMPGRGLWAAGAFATRALVQTAAQEVRDEGIHVALLAVDATIESPKTAERTADTPRDALADQAEIAAAVAYLADQSRRGFTHELTLTPSGERWVP
jgi:NAD(P)-dependent dehydrogenase (short-subunit alcohol dehydrogenase family)